MLYAVLVKLSNGSVSISSACTSRVKNAVSPPFKVPIFQVLPLQVPVMVCAFTRLSPAGISSVILKLVNGPTPRFLTFMVKVAISPSTISDLSTVLFTTTSGSQ
ncbi:Putative protein [Zobellia galactanivorans]|uniref:Uncharacterized protein n=1 Tax=Zobellia galactanivorans (strain DSM 12802 / CCUG 47099 / CIP 106680 / NCIMB 13871 / Dsij) TaxID=63186 RepID=G0LCM6_ZOBGA|nr:Putative protein [Zobellia galactanivorans]